MHLAVILQFIALQPQLHFIKRPMSLNIYLCARILVCISLFSHWLFLPVQWLPHFLQNASLDIFASNIACLGK